MPIPPTPQDTAADLYTFRTLFMEFAASIPDKAWEQRTGSRDKDWTLHETLAHLVSVAYIFNAAAQAALQNTPLHIEGVTQREDLLPWNAAEIAALTAYTPPVLSGRFVAELNKAADLCAQISPETAANTADLRIYNRPATAQDFLDWQLSHAGVIHAAQITRPTDSAPLWERYEPPMMQRMIDRFVRHFSMAYWQQFGAATPTRLNFRIGGEAGGDWHLIGARDGGSAGPGALDHADYEVRFSSPAAMFGVFTVHLPVKDALASGQMQTSGDWREAMQFLALFAPRPPRQ